MKQSGLQREVLSLYRNILREATKKDRNAVRLSSNRRGCLPSFATLLRGDDGRGDFRESTTTSYAASEFRRQARTAKRSDFKKIEYMIRKGEKHLKLLRMPGVKAVVPSGKATDY